MGSKTVFKSSGGQAFIQPDGPNTDLIPLLCKKVGDIQESHGDIEGINIVTSGGGFKALGATDSAPDLITTNIEGLMVEDQDWIEELARRATGGDCWFPLYIKQGACGQKTYMDNFDRLALAGWMKVIASKYTGMVERSEKVQSLYNVDLKGLYPLFVSHKVNVNRMVFPDANQINEVMFNGDQECNWNCGTTYKPGDRGVAVCNSTALAKPKVYLTSDGAITWAATAVDPGSVDDDLASVYRFQHNNLIRIIAAKTAVAASQGKLYITDDSGATWRTINIGGAAAGHGPVKARGIFGFPNDPNWLWLASGGGYIYHSRDAGDTWATREVGTIGVNAYNFINFADKQYGIAGQNSDVIALSNNGGDSWFAAAATGSGANVISGARLSASFAWVAMSTGALYYTTNGGTSWSLRGGWKNAGTGALADIEFKDEYNGVMVQNLGGAGYLHRTYNGGRTWRPYDAPANAGLNSVRMVGDNLLFAGGQPQTALGVMLKAAANRTGGYEG